MKRSVKQSERERLMANQVRQREAHKSMEADRALWMAIGGEIAWQAELCRRRRARNERTRAHVREVVAAKKAALAAEPQAGLWDAA